MMSNSGMTTRQNVVRLVTSGWVTCVWVPDVDTGLVDIWTLAA